MHISYVLSAATAQQDQTNLQMNKLAGNVSEENTASASLYAFNYGNYALYY